MNTANHFIDRKKSRHIIYLEKSVIKLVIRILNPNEITDELMEKLRIALERYYFELCHNGNEYPRHARICSIKRITRFLIVYPKRNNISEKIVEKIYKELWLIDMATFCLSQLSDIEIKGSIIERFLKYVGLTETGIESIFYMYRVNPTFVREKFGCLSVENLSESELYYGVTTGFYEYGKDGNKAVERLKVMQANEVLDKLAHDGFIID